MLMTYEVMKDVKCFICGADMVSYFKKKFPYTGIIEDAEYLRCRDCGMVINKAMYELTAEKWKELNQRVHERYQGKANTEEANDPKWVFRLHRQAEVLFGMFTGGVLKSHMMCVDYGCGDGKLSTYYNELAYGHEECGVLQKYDKFMAKVHGGGVNGYLPETELKEKAFDVVVTCSVFEQLVGIQDVENIVKLLNPMHGVLCTHTLVCEDVPQDAEWFYIDEPVHCTLWTNKAMKKLFSLYGFKGCAYHLEAQMWFFFYDECMFETLKNVRKDITGTWFFSNDFVDYWKGKPYR